jgi:hypothetical protein
MDVQPTFVGGADVADVNNDQSKAYQQLVEMAEEQRRRAPFMTKEQAFARVFEAPENHALAERAHRRPPPTTMYPHPL